MIENSSLICDGFKKERRQIITFYRVKSVKIDVKYNITTTKKG